MLSLYNVYPRRNNKEPIRKGKRPGRALIFEKNDLYDIHKPKCRTSGTTFRWRQKEMPSKLPKYWSQQDCDLFFHCKKMKISAPQKRKLDQKAFAVSKFPTKPKVRFFSEPYNWHRVLATVLVDREGVRCFPLFYHIHLGQKLWALMSIFLSLSRRVWHMSLNKERKSVWLLNKEF